MLVIQFQGADKCLLQLRQEMKRAAQKRDMSPDGLSAGQAADGLIDHCLKNGGGKVFLCGAVVDQRLNIGFREYAAAGGNGVESPVISGVLIESHGVRLQKGSHLIDKGSGASGTDAVHTLFDISTLEINDLGILAAQLDGHICLRRDLLKGGGNSDNLLDKGNLKAVGKSQTAGSGDYRMYGKLAQLAARFSQKRSQRFLDIGKMAFIVRKQQLVRFVKNGDFYRGGTDVDSQGICIGCVFCSSNNCHLLFSVL